MTISLKTKKEKGNRLKKLQVYKFISENIKNTGSFSFTKKSQI